MGFTLLGCNKNDEPKVSQNENLSLSELKELKSELDKAYGDSDIKKYGNDSNGQISDADFNASLLLVNQVLPNLLDDKEIITTTPLCKSVHSSYSNKVMVIFEALTFYAEKYISLGNDLGLNSCGRTYSPYSIDYSSRQTVADLSYQTIIQKCFADGENQFKKLQETLSPMQRISNCDSAKKMQKGAYDITMLPKFKTKFSQ